MLYRLLQSVARAIMYNVSGLVALILLWCLCTLDREFFYRANHTIFYRLSGNIFADDSMNASVFESEDP